jgi:hypothetical protein
MEPPGPFPTATLPADEGDGTGAELLGSGVAVATGAGVAVGTVTGVGVGVGAAGVGVGEAVIEGICPPEPEPLLPLLPIPAQPVTSMPHIAIAPKRIEFFIQNPSRIFSCLLRAYLYGRCA